MDVHKFKEFVTRDYSSVPVLTSQSYYPQSPMLRGILANRKSNLTLLFASNAKKEKFVRNSFSIFVREQRENLITYTLR